MARSVQEVVVVGRDADAWLAALGIQRGVGRLGVRVRVVELPSRLGPHDVYAGLPALHGFHDLLGLRASAPYRECRALPTLGTRFVDWSPGGAFVHAYDVARPAIDDIDFLQFWVDARARGLSVPLEEFSLAAAAALRGRVDDAPGGPDRLGGFVPGLHLDAVAYAALLRRGALAGGATAVAGPLAAVARDGALIRSVTTAAGETVAGDLFVDASGDERALLNGQPGAAFDGWSEWLPCDRLFAGSLPPLRPPPAYAQAAAYPDGWFALVPLADRTALVAATASRGRGDAELARALEAAVGRPVAGLSVKPFAPGAPPRAWIGNCVAIGGASASLEPLDAGTLHLVQTGLSHLVAQWPADADDPVEAAPFNAAIAAHVSALRDFTVAHYRLNGRIGEPTWDAARQAEPPPELAAKLSLFGARGHVPLYDGETFAEQNWSACFVGHGLIPRSVDPRVDGVPAPERIGKIRGLLEVVAEQVRAMPDVETFVAARARTGA